jgi:hypothetical protein
VGPTHDQYPPRHGGTPGTTRPLPPVRRPLCRALRTHPPVLGRGALSLMENGHAVHSPDFAKSTFPWRSDSLPRRTSSPWPPPGTPDECNLDCERQTNPSSQTPGAMNSDPNSRPSLPRVRPITVPVEEELETGEPIPDEEESVPVAKKSPALRGKVETRPTEQAKPARSSCSAKPNSPNESGVGQVVLATAKYLKSQPPESTNRQSNGMPTQNWNGRGKASCHDWACA